MGFRVGSVILLGLALGASGAAGSPIADQGANAAAASQTLALAHVWAVGPNEQCMDGDPGQIQCDGYIPEAMRVPTSSENQDILVSINASWAYRTSASGSATLTMEFQGPEGPLRVRPPWTPMSPSSVWTTTAASWIAWVPSGGSTYGIVVSVHLSDREEAGSIQIRRLLVAAVEYPDATFVGR